MGAVQGRCLPYPSPFVAPSFDTPNPSTFSMRHTYLTPDSTAMGGRKGDPMSLPNDFHPIHHIGGLYAIGDAGRTVPFQRVPGFDGKCWEDAPTRICRTLNCQNELSLLPPAALLPAGSGPFIALPLPAAHSDASAGVTTDTQNCQNELPAPPPPSDSPIIGDGGISGWAEKLSKRTGRSHPSCILPRPPSRAALQRFRGDMGIVHMVQTTSGQADGPDDAEEA